MKLNKKAGLGMFFLIVLTSLAVFTCKATGAGSGGSMDIADESTEAAVAPKLVALAVQFASGNVNLVQDFSPDQTAYAVNLSAEDAGKSLKVTEARAEEGADSPLIKVGEDVVQTGSLISPPAGAAKVISVSVSRGALSTLYTVTILPPADYYSYSLASLQAVYTGTSVDQIQNFDAEVVNYSFNTDAAHANGAVNITAIPSSSAASLSIRVRGESPFPDEHTVSVDLPPAGVYRYVDITVTSPESADPGQGGSRVYTVTILGYQPSTATWTAAVSGAPMTITAVTIFDSSPTQIAIAMQNKGGGSFEAATALNYNGKTFVVSMTDGALSYSTQAITPVISGALGGNRSVSLDLNGVAYGRTISNATELYNLTLPENSAESWSVIADITLPDDAEWNGPGGFSGAFYGNGHTISLTLTRTSGSEGLFSSLGAGALIENFTLNVATSEALKNSLSIESMSFGGVVGKIENTATISKVTVRGTLEFNNYATSSTVGLQLGGLVGQVGFNVNGLDIEKCVSEVNITIKNVSNNAPNTHGYGGLIGVSHGRVNIRDCYTTGNIQITTNKNLFIGAGGLIGSVGSSNSHSVPWELLIHNSYASGEIVINCTGRTTWSVPPSIGGLIGMLRYAHSITVENSAAINPKLVIVTGTGNEAYAKINRLYGGFSADNYIEAATFTNNIARRGILTGTTLDGTPNEAVGAVLETAEATGLPGYGVSESALHQASTWTTQATDGAGFSGLGWSTDVWDFSGVGTGWPVLK